MNYRSTVRALIDSARLRLQGSENSVLLLIAVAVGLATALGIWAFREGIEFFHLIFVEQIADHLLHPIISAGAIIISLGFAGFIIGLLMDRFVGEERHHGVAGIMEAVALAGGRLRYRRMPFKALASAISLGAGASVGPEDPSVQIGANLGSWIGQRLRFPEELVRILVAAGAASAIAAAFKAPIAGVFFALEVILYGSFGTSAVSVIILAAVVSSALTQAIEPHPEMGPFSYTLGGVIEIPFFIPLGFILAPIAVLFMRSVYWQHDLWHHYIHLPRPIKTALAGMIVGTAGVFLPEILGPGRETMNAVLSGEAQIALFTLLIIGVVKILMTSISMAGGFVGGIFAPSLFVGIMFGAVYGQLVDQLFRNTSVSGDPQAYAIAGMAGMMAGVVRSPITAIMMVFELTNDYRLILPIMLTSVICMLVAEKFEPLGIYAHGLRRKGVRLPEGRDIDVMQGVTVSEAMVSPAPVIPEKASLSELRDALRKSNSLSLCVVNEDCELVGIVTLSDLQKAYDREEKPASVGDICSRNLIVTYPDEVLWSAIQKMSLNDVGRLPVIKPGTREILGLIGRHGVVRAYNIALSRKLQDQHNNERIRLNTLTGAHVFELNVTSQGLAAGKHISDIHWPAESVIASIQRKGKLIVPHGSTEIKTGDVLTIVADPMVEKELVKLTGN